MGNGFGVTHKDRIPVVTLTKERNSGVNFGGREYKCITVEVQKNDPSSKGNNHIGTAANSATSVAEVLGRKTGTKPNLKLLVDEETGKLSPVYPPATPDSKKNETTKASDRNTTKSIRIKPNLSLNLTGDDSTGEIGSRVSQGNSPTTAQRTEKDIANEEARKSLSSLLESFREGNPPSEEKTKEVLGIINALGDDKGSISAKKIGDTEYFYLHRLNLGQGAQKKVSLALSSKGELNALYDTSTISASDHRREMYILSDTHPIEVLYDAFGFNHDGTSFTLGSDDKQKMSDAGILPIEALKDHNVEMSTITPFCDLGTGESYLNKCATEKQVLEFAKDILTGLKTLNTMQIVHRDLKLDNILVRTEKVTHEGEEQRIAKAYVSDFDTSIKAEGWLKNPELRGVNFNHSAPELIAFISSFSADSTTEEINQDEKDTVTKKEKIEKAKKNV